MKLTIIEAETEADRRALLALVGSALSASVPVTATPAIPAEALTPDPLAEQWARGRDPYADADPVEDDDDRWLAASADAADAEPLAEPVAGPFGADDTTEAPKARQAGTEAPMKVGLPPGVDALSEKMFDTYCYLFDRYRPGGGVHYRAFAAYAKLLKRTANNRMHRLVALGLAENPSKGIFRAVVEVA